MSQASHRDLEGGSDAVNDSNQLPQLSWRELDSADGPFPLYSMYSKIVQEDDNKMVERCQKHVDGTLVFSGLFSATIAALLSVTIPDLKPNSQDTSAFYLANIYRVLGNPNVSNVTTASTLVEPPAFSPPIYAIWVNSLWFLSLSFSLTAATKAMHMQNWALRYMSIVQAPWHPPDKRARIRAVFARDNPGPYIYWGTSGEPLFLHISVFLFLIGGLIYLFNINRAVFGAVVWFILIVSIDYVQFTVQPMFKLAMLFCSPFTPWALYLYIGILYAVTQVCSCIRPLRSLSDHMTSHYRVLRDRYRHSFEVGKTKEAEEIASRTSEVDAWILVRILFALDDDDSQETFFDSIPGFCNPKLANRHLLGWVGDKFRQKLNGFLDRTFTSNFVSESVRIVRLITCLNAARAALGPDAVQGILYDIFKGRRIEALQSVETAHSLRRWSNTNDDFAVGVRRIVACVVVYAQGRDDSWVTLVKDEFGIPEGVLRDNLEHGDSVLLAILIHAVRQALRTRHPERDVLQSLSGFDIHNTLPGLQRDFCALWNEIILEARHDILDGIRQAHIALHQGTDAALTASSAPTSDSDSILPLSSSYSLCDIASHRPDSTSHRSVTTSPADIPPIQLGDFPTPFESRSPDGSTEEPNVIIGTPSLAGPPDTQQFHAPSPATDPIHTAPQIISVTSHSAPEAIDTIVQDFQDLNQLVSVDAPRHSYQSAPAAETAACMAQRDDPTPVVHASERGETSQIHTATSLHFLEPNPVQIPIAPSTGPDMSSSVPRPGHVPDVLQHTTTIATFSHTAESNKCHDTATPCAASDGTQIPSTADPPQSRASGTRATLWTRKDTTCVPPTIVPNSPSSPIELPALCSGVSPAELPSSRIQPDRISHVLGSSSSSLTTTRPDVPLHVASNFDASVSTSFRALSGHHNTPDSNSSIQMEVIPNRSESGSPALDVVMALRAEDRLGSNADE